MVTTSNLEENEKNDLQVQLDEGEDYGLPQLDFSPLDPLEFNKIGITSLSSSISIDDKTQPNSVSEEPSEGPPLVEVEETSAYIYQGNGNQKLKFIFVVVLGVLSVSIIGITLLSMAEDPKPIVKKEVKKAIKPGPVIEEVIESDVAIDTPEPEPVVEEVIESEVVIDMPNLEPALKSTGAIPELTQPMNKYFLIVASFLDKDLAIDYSNELTLSGSKVIIIPPFSKSRFTRVALGEYETLETASVGINNYKDEFNEQLWVLKY